MSNLHILNLSSYNRPEITESKNKEWVNYGVDNNYYQYIIDCYNGSATNNAIINGVVNMIYGKGLDATNSSKKPNEYAQMKSIFSNDNVRKTVLDLKLLGEGSMQVIYKNGKVYKAEHFPRQTLRAEKCNENGEIEAYYYHYDWSKLKPSDKPKRIPAFGFGNGKESEIKIIKRYVSGFDYYAPVDYQGGLAYAELEKEVADYLINEVQCGFSGTKVVNFNNGVPDREKQLQVKDDVLGKLTGSRGEKVIVAFNNNAESKTTVDDIPLNDAPQHYEYLSNECVKKLIISHRVTSPLLIGVKDGNSGLGNNAEEIKTATLLFDNIVIKPYQGLLTDCFDAILAVNGISLNLYFKTLQPLEFTETEDIVNEEQREEETGVKLSSDISKFIDTEVADTLIDLGQTEEELLKDFELIDESEVDYELEDEQDQKIKELNDQVNLANTGSAKPYRDSKQDGKSKQKGQEDKIYLVRYMYAPNRVSPNTREFCRKMIAAKKVYRKEDIVAMTDKVVNAGFGKGGSNTYSVWLYKGGARCQHKWFRRIYARKEGSKSLGNVISTREAKSQGFKPEANAQKVPVAPKDMKYKGYTAAYWKKMGFKN